MPDAPGKYFYVWLDAPIGYLAALKKHFDSGAARRAYPGETRTFDQFIAADAVEQYHFIGKDIVYFHTLFWPAMLQFSERKTPTNVFVHGFSSWRRARRCRSRAARASSPQRYVELGMNPEWLRYYIAAKLNDRVEDLDFNPDDFVARVNSDLVGKYVNIASRAATFLARHFDGAVQRRVRRQAGLVARLDRRRGGGNPRPRSTSAQYGQRDAQDHGDRRPDQPLLRRDAAVGCSPRTREARRSCTTSAASASCGFKNLTVFLAPVLPATTRAAADFLGLRRDLRLVRPARRAAARRRLQAPA